MTLPVLLALDSTGPWCSAVLSSNGNKVTESEDIGRGHAERLAPMVQSLFQQADRSPSELDRVGVATGPGSFAGTRVGVAFARGLALATGAQAVGITSLEVLARRADPDGAHTVAVLHDAKRDELIWQIFTHGRAVTQVERGDIAQARQVIIEFGDVRLTGSGAIHLGADPDHFDPEPPLDALLTLTAEAPDDAPLPAPLYARPPDAIASSS